MGTEYHSCRYMYVAIEQYNAIESCFTLSLSPTIAPFSNNISTTPILPTAAAYQRAVLPFSYHCKIRLNIIIMVLLSDQYPIFDIWISLCFNQSCYDISRVIFISHQHETGESTLYKSKNKIIMWLVLIIFVTFSMISGIAPALRSISIISNRLFMQAKCNGVQPSCMENINE